MRAIAFAALALVLAGCETPAVTGVSRDAVVIRYDPTLYNEADVQPQADAECGRFGKKARFAGHDQKPIIQWRHARFDCR